jgi:hypothetical protein
MSQEKLGKLQKTIGIINGIEEGIRFASSADTFVTKN